MSENNPHPPKAELKRRLTDLQYRVTQEEATEPAFSDNYHDHQADGIYLSIVTGQPLFDSRDKFDSGSGWPSFTRPIHPQAVATHADRKFLMVRTEVHEASGGAHLGHVFNDGPEPTGLRYCINGAALKFVPRHDLGPRQTPSSPPQD